MPPFVNITSKQDFTAVSTSAALTITETIDLSGPECTIFTLSQTIEANGTSYFPTPAVTLSSGQTTVAFKYPNLTLATLLGHNNTILMVHPRLFPSYICLVSVMIWVDSRVKFGWLGQELPRRVGVNCMS